VNSKINSYDLVIARFFLALIFVVEEIVAGAIHATNAAEATIRGIDIDATINPAPNLMVIAAAEVPRGRYDSFPNGQFYVYNPSAGGNCLSRVRVRALRHRTTTRPLERGTLGATTPSKRRLSLRA
jgi:hypothetical protein